MVRKKIVKTMAKFKVNQRVLEKESGKLGVIRAKEVDKKEKHTDVKYLVDFHEGIENWKIMRRKDLLPYVKPKAQEYIFKTYEVDGGQVITMAAHVETEKVETFDEFLEDYVKTSFKSLTIGFSIYNGTDEYDEAIGQKFAKHRCKTNPFVLMTSDCRAEFNVATVKAIMDVKAQYIKANFSKFYRTA